MKITYTKISDSSERVDRYIYSHFLRFDKDYILSLDATKKYIVLDIFLLILHI